MGRWGHVSHVLVAHGVIFLVVGGAATRLNGAPVEAAVVDVLVRPDQRNRRHLARALELQWIGSHLHVTFGWSEAARRAAWLLDTVERPLRPRQIRVACIDDLPFSPPPSPPGR